MVCLFASLHNSERCVEECGNRVTASAPNGVGSTLLPSHPLSLYPDKGKPFSRSDGAKHLWGSPFLYSIHPSFPPGLFSLLLPLLLSFGVFWRGLHKNWSAFLPGKQMTITGKAIRSENYFSFTELCSVKAWICSRKKKKKSFQQNQKGTLIAHQFLQYHLGIVVFSWSLFWENRPVQYIKQLLFYLKI